MKILLTGSAGQLGHALRQQLPAGVELIATSRSGDPGTGMLPTDLLMQNPRNLPTMPKSITRPHSFFQIS